MTANNIKSLSLPKQGSIATINTTNQSILLIGANGSGKTRLGTWIEIESPTKNLVHRISAQKSLAMPDTTTPTSSELAEKDLLFGYTRADYDSGHVYKAGNRWSNRPATTMLNDFEKLMVYLFSDETESNAKYKAEQKSNLNRIEPPITKLDIIKNLWEKILPHRELIVGGLRIQTKIKNSSSAIYNSSEMSDGERVIFYLIGQCLAAPKDGVIIIDEPEIHLHKSVQIPLWTEIEALRSDCLFVYLTHDIDFAASKENSQRVWLKSFDGETWDWEKVVEDNKLPNSLLLEIIGSRKPVVFVEGDNGSLDVALYRAILPSFLIIPRGSCTEVIQSVKALKNNSQLHHLEAYGIIDRDRRVQREVDSLEESSIFVLKVAEVENLFCTKDLLKIVSNRLDRDPEADLRLVYDAIFKRLNQELEVQTSLQVASEIKFKLNLFNEKAKGLTGLKNALDTLYDNINIASLYNSETERFNCIIENKDYDQLLLTYNRKSLTLEASAALGLKNGELQEFVVRLAKGSSKLEITQALMPYFGNFQSIIESNTL
ncbi:MAG: DUF4435 domain-containing protein [Cobetia sp.]